IRAQGEATDRGRLFFFHHLEEQLRNELQSLGMEAGLADIDVVVRRRARAEHELAEAHRAVEEHLPELVTRCDGHLRSFLARGGTSIEHARRERPESRTRAPLAVSHGALYTSLYATAGFSFPEAGRLPNNHAPTPADCAALAASRSCPGGAANLRQRRGN